MLSCSVLTNCTNVTGNTHHSFFEAHSAHNSVATGSPAFSHRPAGIANRFVFGFAVYIVFRFGTCSFTFLVTVLFLPVAVEARGKCCAGAKPSITTPPSFSLLCSDVVARSRPSLSLSPPLRFSRRPRWLRLPRPFPSPQDGAVNGAADDDKTFRETHRASSFSTHSYNRDHPASNLFLPIRREPP